jgi:SAM-dependent methyltransferase
MTRAVSRAFVYRVPGEAEECPACASRRLDDLDVLRVRRPGRGVCTGLVSGCADCGAVFSNPLPSVHELADFYSPAGEWRRTRTEQPRSDDVPRGTRGRSWSKRFNAIRGELRVWAPSPGMRVLDFGCGTGRLLDAFQEHGWETWGIEPAVDDAFQRHRRLNEVPERPTFNLIVANHVLEHITYPLTLLRQFATATRSGGYLFVSVPRLDTLPIHRDYAYVINGRAHVMAYTWTCLAVLLGRAGWQPVEPPPHHVPKGRGRVTCSRLQVIARRVDNPSPIPGSPLIAAREAFRGYYQDAENQSILSRLGFHRMVARAMETERRQRLRIRKSATRDSLV